MPDITNPVVLRFLAERVRPRAEQIRALLHLLQDDRAEYLAENIAALVPNDASAIVDGRAGEGVAQLTGAEFHEIVVVRYAELLAALEGVGAMAAVQRAAVRSLQVTLQ